MTGSFFERPILNSPYAAPGRHWELNDERQPTGIILDRRRRSDLVTPVPPPRRRRAGRGQRAFAFDAGDDLSTAAQEYNPTPIINEIRIAVAAWRALPNASDWQVSPETARLLRHWRHHEFRNQRPFFCQVEAVETAIWLAEVAPRLGARTRNILEHLRGANAAANPELARIALKLATGAGKTTVMAMLIAWQVVNAVRHPNSRAFSRGFLLVAPGITIRDRLRVLQPNDPDSYYRTRELLPPDLLPDLDRARIVITNYHAFKRRERLEVAKGTREALEGWRGERLATLESEGQMLQRVIQPLLGLKHIVVLNDEAHHCYRERPDPEENLTGEARQEARDNNEAARLWISGIEAMQRKLGPASVYDLSATPFFLRGSGYREGTLFPWTMSDFSLLDAIECGIVKLPRVPIADNVPGGDTPRFRDLWPHISDGLPKTGRGKAGTLDPHKLPPPLLSALEALYGHYVKRDAAWREAGIAVPPVFIIVCNNTATSELVYQYIAGFDRAQADGSVTPEPGRLALFRNTDEYGNRLGRPNTILVDSAQLESGEALDKGFRDFSADAIARFREELVQRHGAGSPDSEPDDATLLREVMNTVGKRDRLGEQIRCVVSVAMLTEGWDANTVTHILGVRAFGTQLLCEQVVGRGLRRQSYALNDDGLFNVEYADILGIPFDFTAKPVIAPPATPRETVHVHAIRPDRDALELTFPRVEGYRVGLPATRIEARFTADSTLVLTPDMVGATITRNSGLIGEAVDLTLNHLEDVRESTVLFHLTRHLLAYTYRDAGEPFPTHLFGPVKRIVRQWLDAGHLRCIGGTFPAQLLYRELADRAAERIKLAIVPDEDRPIEATLDPYNPTGTTGLVSFNTSKATRWETDLRRCHVNWVVCDSDWEAEFCRVAERHPRVKAYVKNQGLGLEVPYVLAGEARRYRPDFLLRVEDGGDDALNLVVEIKGFRGEDAAVKAETMRACWIPGVNRLGRYGRWAFAEFSDVFEIEAAFGRLLEGLVLRTAVPA